LLVSILSQNPNIHGESVSSLCDLVSSINHSWSSFDNNQVSTNDVEKFNTLKALLNNYHTTDKSIVFDYNKDWIKHIGLLEQITESKIKVLCPVRNPAEILSSYEKLRKNNPTKYSPADSALGSKTSIAEERIIMQGLKVFWVLLIQ